MADHVRTEVAIVTTPVPLLADFFRQVEDDRHRQHVMLTSQLDEGRPRLLLNIGRINHRQPTRL